MGRHVNDDAGTDEAEAREPSERADGAEANHDAARHVAAAGSPLEPQAVISPDTHVGADVDKPAAGTPDAAASPANPDALVEHGQVGDGHEME